LEVLANLLGFDEIPSHGSKRKVETIGRVYDLFGEGVAIWLRKFTLRHNLVPKTTSSSIHQHEEAQGDAGNTPPTQFTP